MIADGVTASPSTAHPPHPHARGVSRRPRIIILGGGFGGAYCAQALERDLHSAEAEVVLIDRHNYFLFYPLLIEAGTGALEPRHAVVSIRSFLRRTTFMMAEVMSVDPRERRVHFRVAGDFPPESITYDHLVIALGSVTRLPPVPGLREHGFEIKNIADAVALRDRAIQAMEIAQNTPDYQTRREILHWVIVGGNFTGVEVAAEFQAFLRRISRKYSNVPKDDIGVTLVERGDRLLQSLDPDLSTYAHNNMSRRGIDIRLRSSATALTGDTVTVHGIDTGVSETIRSRTCVWCAGIQPPPLTTQMGFPVDARGYIVCDADLRVTGHTNIWAIGDAGVNRDPEGNPYPATAQHALREGRWCAANIARAIRGKPTRPCVIYNQGQLAALGFRTGVAKVYGIKLSGFPAWFLWRTVYLFKMPGWARRIRMALDWTVDLFLPRDDVALGIHRPTGLLAGPEGAGGTAAPVKEEFERHPATIASR